MPTRLALALTALALLLLPSTALATFTAERDVVGETVTVTGDDLGDVLIISDDGARVTHNLAGTGGLQTAADWDTEDGEQVVFLSDAPEDQFQFVISAAGGADQVTVTAQKIKGITADLGAGDDLFQGATGPASSADTIDGGDGNDRIAGGRNPVGTNDVARGGEGADTLVWNQGDGNDAMDGEGGGFDTAEINGAALGDVITIRPGPGGLSVERTNLVPFVVTVGATATERVQVNGLGGNDDVRATDSLGLRLDLRGGTGDDTLQGAGAADLLSGGESKDTLAGGGGDDVLAGDRGDDSMTGGDGSDRMVWNNGDDNDSADGEAGFDVMEVNGAAAGDVFTVKPSGDRTQFNRTNLEPFAISLTAEVLDLNMLDGNDAVTVADGTAALIDADGGGGDDVLTGGNGRDALRGGAGNDGINGGAGTDVLDGDEGDDTITARDDHVDAVGCGAGADKATLDGGDAAADCETADRPPVAVNPPAASSVVRILTGKAKVSKRRASLRLQCAGTAACAGSVVLSTARTVKIGRARVVVVLGSARFAIRAGTTATVRVKLTRSLKAVAQKKKSLRARAVAGAVTRDVTLTRGKRW